MLSDAEGGPRVLVVEDDDLISDLILVTLRDLGASFLTAGTVEAAVAAARSWQPDVITLDLTLADGDGSEVCRRVREFSDAFIVMLTGRSDEVDRLLGLEIGADDYIVKPFSPRELRARVAVLLRRLERSSNRVQPERPDDGASRVLVAAGGRLSHDRGSGETVVDGKPLLLTPHERTLMALLSERPGHIWARRELGEALFAGGFVESDFLLDVQVAGLRRKLEEAAPDREWIRTVSGSTYALVP